MSYMVFGILRTEIDYIVVGKIENYCFSHVALNSRVSNGSTRYTAFFRVRFYFFPFYSLFNGYLVGRSLREF